jgi:hypothetical protein
VPTTAGADHGLRRVWLLCPSYRLGRTREGERLAAGSADLGGYRIYAGQGCDCALRDGVRASRSRPRHRQRGTTSAISGDWHIADTGRGIEARTTITSRFGLLWTMLLTYPLMVAIQSVSARLGRVAGRGLATNLRRHTRRPLPKSSSS